MILPGKDGYFRPRTIKQLETIISQKVSFNKIIFVGSLYKEIILCLEALEKRVDALEIKKGKKVE